MATSKHLKTEKIKKNAQNNKNMMFLYYFLCVVFKTFLKWYQKNIITKAFARSRSVTNILSNRKTFMRKSLATMGIFD